MEVQNKSARPFLKWVGGKSHLVPVLLERVRQAGRIAGYHEPFVGGGALFFAMRAEGLLPPRVSISDISEELISTYKVVRDEVEDLIDLLGHYKAEHCKEFYYKVREFPPTDELFCAARMIYLNKTCFNGLYRVNRSGKFNTTMGSYKNPCICDAENLRAVSLAMQEVDIFNLDFEHVFTEVTKGHLVYFDPPYWPTSATANFVSYAADGFTKRNQETLAAEARTLTKHGVKVLLSNSDVPEVRELYKDFTVETVSRPGNMNSRGTGRARVGEILVRNF